MSDSYRRDTFKVGLIATVVGAVLVFSYAAIVHFSRYQNEHIEERQNASEHYRSEANEPINLCLRSFGEERFGERLRCLSEAIDSAADSAAAKYDLKAQQDMAEWAFAVVLISIAALIATIIGVGFVWATLRETRRIGQSQVRAYLNISIQNTSSFDEGIAAEVHIRIGNTGQSPARNVTRALEIKVVNEPIQIDAGVLGLAPEDGKFSAVPASGSIYVSNVSAKITKEQIAAIRDRRAAICIFAIVKYETVFESFHTERSAFVARADDETLLKWTSNHDKPDLTVRYLFIDAYNYSD